MSDKTPVEAEAVGETTATIEHKALGVRFEIPRDVQEWPASAAFALDANNGLRMLRELMPTKQLQRVLDDGVKMKDLRPLIEQITSALGFDSAGESSASAD